jgi:hypothetical protein
MPRSCYRLMGGTAPIPLCRSVVREEVSSFAINSAASSSECRSMTRTNPNAIMTRSSFHSIRILGSPTQAKAGYASWFFC